MKIYSIALCLLLASCASVDKKKDNSTQEQKAPEPAKPKVPVTTLVGRVQSRPGNKNFILIEAYKKWTIEEGSTLHSRGVNERSATLITSGEKLGQFIAADIESGTLEIGDAVYHTAAPITSPTPEPTPATNPEPAITPVAPSLP